MGYLVVKQKGAPKTVRRFRSMAEFVTACERREIPHDLYSPGWAANEYGIARQTVHDAIWAGRLEAIYVEGGYVFVVKSGCERLWGSVD